jgi:DNA-binding YbaB/EbfC family protein
MIGDFMGKMQEAQQQMEETKKRLDGVYVDAEVENGLIKVTASANMKLTNISIADELLNDKEALEDLIITAVNKVMEKAKEVQEVEMAKVAQGMLPNLGGLFG